MVGGLLPDSMENNKDFLHCFKIGFSNENKRQTRFLFTAAKLSWPENARLKTPFFAIAQNYLPYNALKAKKFGISAR